MLNFIIINFLFASSTFLPAQLPSHTSSSYFLSVSLKSLKSIQLTSPHSEGYNYHWIFLLLALPVLLKTFTFIHSLLSLLMHLYLLPIFIFGICLYFNTLFFIYPIHRYLNYSPFRFDFSFPLPIPYFSLVLCITLLLAILSRCSYNISNFNPNIPTLLSLLVLFCNIIFFLNN